jgi:hypothetical protein
MKKDEIISFAKGRAKQLVSAYEADIRILKDKQDQILKAFAKRLETEKIQSLEVEINER